MFNHVHEAGSVESLILDAKLLNVVAAHSARLARAALSDDMSDVNDSIGPLSKSINPELIFEEGEQISTSINCSRISKKAVVNSRRLSGMDTT